MGDTDLDAIGEVTLGEVIDAHLKGNDTVVDREASASIWNVERRVNSHNAALYCTNRRTELWINNLDIWSTFWKKAIAEERTGSFSMHMWAVKETLQYVAAYGHNFYAKSARLYVQKMSALEKTNPELFQAFIDGFLWKRRYNMLPHMAITFMQNLQDSMSRKCQRWKRQTRSSFKPLLTASTCLDEAKDIGLAYHPILNWASFDELAEALPEIEDLMKRNRSLGFFGHLRVVK